MLASVRYSFGPAKRLNFRSTALARLDRQSRINQRGFKALARRAVGETEPARQSAAADQSRGPRFPAPGRPAWRRGRRTDCAARPRRRCSRRRDTPAAACRACSRSVCSRNTAIRVSWLFAPSLHMMPVAAPSSSAPIGVAVPITHSCAGRVEGLARSVLQPHAGVDQIIRAELKFLHEAQTIRERLLGAHECSRSGSASKTPSPCQPSLPTTASTGSCAWAFNVAKPLVGGEPLRWCETTSGIFDQRDLAQTAAERRERVTGVLIGQHHRLRLRCWWQTSGG